MKRIDLNSVKLGYKLVIISAGLLMRELGMSHRLVIAKIFIYVVMSIECNQKQAQLSIVCFCCILRKDRCFEKFEREPMECRVVSYQMKRKAYWSAIHYEKSTWVSCAHLTFSMHDLGFQGAKIYILIYAHVSYPFKFLTLSLVFMHLIRTELTWHTPQYPFSNTVSHMYSNINVITT